MTVAVGDDGVADVMMSPVAPLATRTDRLLGLAPVAAAFTATTARDLRVLAYHGVRSPEAFRRHLDLLRAHYHPVSGAEVAAAFDGDDELPARSVWVTFDDGRADVVEAGLAELERAAITATMFVCPGLIERGAPFWWDVVVDAVEQDGPYALEGRPLDGPALVRALMRVPDAERRRVVDELAERTPSAITRPGVLTPGQLSRWADAGQEVGNHSWDHPCLDRCGAVEQRSQVVRAHDALTSMLGTAPTLFAYPNGDWAEAAESALVEYGYRIGLLFDHRLAGRSQHPLRLSRLRIDADAPVERAAAILSGGHSTIFQARARLTGSGRGA